MVADEVRKLAERTSMSTTEIAGMVEKIQNGTRNAVSSMQTGVTQADKGVALANEAGVSRSSASAMAPRVVDVVNDISSSIPNRAPHRATSPRISNALPRCRKKSAQAVQQTTDAARHLQELSAALHASVSRFRRSRLQENPGKRDAPASRSHCRPYLLPASKNR